MPELLLLMCMFQQIALMINFRAMSFLKQYYMEIQLPKGLELLVTVTVERKICKVAILEKLLECIYKSLDIPENDIAL